MPTHWLDILSQMSIRALLSAIGATCKKCQGGRYADALADICRECPLGVSLVPLERVTFYMRAV